jgi:hypothetical protein
MAIKHEIRPIMANPEIDHEATVLRKHSDIANAHPWVPPMFSRFEMGTGGNDILLWTFEREASSVFT